MTLRIFSIEYTYIYILYSLQLPSTEPKNSPQHIQLFTATNALLPLGRIFLSVRRYLYLLRNLL